MRFLSIGIVAALCALGGCISAEPPTARVVDARVIDATSEGVSLMVRVALENPNSVPLPMTHSRYTLVVPGVGTFDYEMLPAKVIPPHGRQTLDLPAAAALVGGENASQRRPWRLSGTVTYEPENQARAFLSETGVALPYVLFSGQGVLPGTAP